jgi:hypothetical protein
MGITYCIAGEQIKVRKVYWQKKENSLSFCLSEKTLISPSILKGNFIGHGIQNWLFGLHFLSTLNISFISFFTCLLGFWEEDRCNSYLYSSNENYTSPLLEWLSWRIQATTNVGKDVGKRNPHTLLVGM